MSERVLLLGVYGMEMVECGGALAANVRAGGESFATLMLCADEMRRDVTVAAQILGVDVTFTDFVRGEVNVDEEGRRALVREIRRVRPTIVITQDPEHSLTDLDPDRRPAMTLLLEAMALAGRDWRTQECGDPHVVPTVYFMSAARPNCIVDIAPVWAAKVEAMDVLVSQLEFSGQHWARELSEADLELLVPGFHGLKDDVERGRAIHRVLDRARHIHAGVGHHGRYALAESFRREGDFHLSTLVR